MHSSSVFPIFFSFLSEEKLKKKSPLNKNKKKKHTISHFPLTFNSPAYSIKLKYKLMYENKIMNGSYGCSQIQTRNFMTVLRSQFESHEGRH